MPVLTGLGNAIGQVLKKGVQTIWRLPAGHYHTPVKEDPDHPGVLFRHGHEPIGEPSAYAISFYFRAPSLAATDPFGHVWVSLCGGDTMRTLSYVAKSFAGDTPDFKKIPGLLKGADDAVDPGALASRDADGRIQNAKYAADHVVTLNLHDREVVVPLSAEQVYRTQRTGLRLQFNERKISKADFDAQVETLDKKYAAGKIAPATDKVHVSARDQYEMLDKLFTLIQKQEKYNLWDYNCDATIDEVAKALVAPDAQPAIHRRRSNTLPVSGRHLTTLRSTLRDRRIQNPPARDRENSVDKPAPVI